MTDQPQPKKVPELFALPLMPFNLTTELEDACANDPVFKKEFLFFL
jgi:hypothetical protein